MTIVRPPPKRPASESKFKEMRVLCVDASRAASRYQTDSIQDEVRIERLSHLHDAGASCSDEEYFALQDDAQKPPEWWTEQDIAENQEPFVDNLYTDVPQSIGSHQRDPRFASKWGKTNNREQKEPRFRTWDEVRQEAALRRPR